MYKKFVMQLFLCNMVLLTSWFCVKGVQMNMLSSTPAFKISLYEYAQDEPEMDRFHGFLKKAASGQRVVDYSVIEKKYKYDLSQADYEALLKIVQAEAGTEVVLNSVKNRSFTDTVKEVVMQNKNGVYQFSPVGAGTYQTIKVTQSTIDAVERVLMGEDVSEGALYFVSRKSANPEKVKWFDTRLTKLFTHGGHEFFTTR